MRGIFARSPERCGQSGLALVPGSLGGSAVERKGLALKAPCAGVPGRSFTLALPYSVMATSERRMQHRQVVVSKSLINAIQSRI